jgi:SPASM domain peptide maturase of grasp-with-spasm system
MSPEKIKSFYFKLFPNCIISRGSANAIIFDLQRHKTYSIPLKLYEILDSRDGELIENIYSDFDTSYWSDVDEYFDFLISNDLIYLDQDSSNLKSFVPIEFSYDNPSTLSNVIISFDTVTQFNLLFHSIVTNLTDVLCEHIQLRLGPKISFNNICQIISKFQAKAFLRSMSLIIPSNHFDNLSNMSFKNSYPLVNQIILYGNSLKLKDHEVKEKQTEIILLEDNNFPNFPKLNELRFLYFQTNIVSFSEAKNYNLYYNKKAYINGDGNVYQSPYSLKIFGNILKSSLRSITTNHKFQQYWSITKDKILVCKDCEFRYACADGRIPLKKDYSEFYYFDSDCSYDPYSEN